MNISGQRRSGYLTGDWGLGGVLSSAEHGVAESTGQGFLVPY